MNVLILKVIQRENFGEFVNTYLKPTSLEKVLG